MKKEFEILTIILMAVFLATLLKGLLPFKKATAGTPALPSTGDALLDEVYADHPEADPRRN